MVELVPVDYDPFAAEKFVNPEVKEAVGNLTKTSRPAPDPNDPVRYRTASPLVNITQGDIDRGIGVALSSFGEGGGRPKFKPVEHDPFAHDPKLAQFERLEKKGAPENITRSLTGLYRDSDGTIRKVGEQAKQTFESLEKEMDELLGKKSSKESYVFKRANLQEAQKAEVKAEPKVETKVESKEQVYQPKWVLHENAQPEFVNQVRGYHDKMPLEARRIIHSGGGQVHLAEKLIDIRPDLEGVCPRGWPAGFTWESAEGGARAGEVFLSRTRLDRALKRYVPSYRIEGVYNHESGHAVDYFLDWHSQSERFLKPYKRDYKRIMFDNEAMDELEYYVQRGPGGPSEAFAELFAQMYGPGSSYYKIGKHFPETEAYLKDLFKTIKETK